ncbi:MAG: hypothetical protein AUJ49_09115 [Desulfovibrionaceae bacterium CG1_02_65_16]|nr:MAG: hypothetical protein AUJ49_09115 [Desulfovibrionaceae bacterium CG1_02_65_16]
MADKTEGTGKAAAGESKQADAMIDTSEASLGAQKVELDLEDAPFLEEEEEVQPEPPKQEAPVSLESEEKKPSRLAGKKKLIIIVVAAVVLLVATVLMVKLFFFKGKAASEPAQADHAEATKQPDNATQAAPELQVRLDPFWVEQKGANDEIRFLIVRILLTTTSQSTVRDFQIKLLPARNAVFYYLKNKDVQFLSDEQNAERLKGELLLVINQYVADGKFDNLMFEEYVVK